MKDFFAVIRRYVPPYRKYLVLTIVFNLLSAVMNIFSFAALIPILQIIFQTADARTATHLMAWDWQNLRQVAGNNLDYYVTGLIDHYGQLWTLVFIGLFLILTTAVKTLLYFAASAVVIPMRTGIIRDMRNQLYRKVNALPMGFFTQERKGDIIARMTGDVTQVETSIMTSLDMLFKQPILIIAYFSTLLVISWQLTLFTLVFVPIMGSIMGVIGKKLKAKSMRAQNLWSDTMSMVEETLGGLRIIKAFGAERRMNERFARINDEQCRATMRVGIRQASAHPVSEFLGTVMIVIVLWFGGYLVLNDMALSSPTFIYYMVILYSIIQPLKDFSRAGYAIPVGLASVERIDKILTAENNIREAEHPRRITDFQHQIELRNVSFRYDERWVLRNVSLTIRRGETIALVGQSGGGKSTLLDLIPRFFDVEEGEVLVDGINVKDLSISDLRSLFGNVNQDSILFNDNFRNNIAFGTDDASLDDVRQAALAANALDFIEQSEHGFDTPVGDRGSRLSGGQRQRIGIARAILKNPPILILDEATSALDTESERLVQESLERLMASHTTIAVAHRLSTIRRATRIYVLHDGQIVEQGTHDELLQLNGYYRRLHEMQQ